MDDERLLRHEMDSVVKNRKCCAEVSWDFRGGGER